MTSKLNMLDEHPWLSFHQYTDNPYLRFYDAPDPDIFPARLDKQPHASQDQPTAQSQLQTKADNSSTTISPERSTFFEVSSPFSAWDLEIASPKAGEVESTDEVLLEEIGKDQMVSESGGRKQGVFQAKCYQPSNIVKNATGNSVKVAIKQYLSSKYKKIVGKIYQSLGITEPDEAQQFIRKHQNQSISLKDIYSLFDYDQRQPIGVYKKAFLIFYRWFMRQKYAAHVFNQQKIQHKEIYIQTKNKLVYLPGILKAKKRLRKKNSVLSQERPEELTVFSQEQSLQNDSHCDKQEHLQFHL